MKIILPYLIMASITALLITALPITQVDLPGFTAERGQELWNQTHTVSGKVRSCASCHTSDPRQAGKHVRTGNALKPMAPSVNPDRCHLPNNIAKWIKRKCKCTQGW